MYFRRCKESEANVLPTPPRAVGTAGIKEGLYDTEALASYLLYRLNVLDPVGE